MNPVNHLTNTNEATTEITEYLNEHGLSIVFSLVFAIIFIKATRYLVSKVQIILDQKKIDQKITSVIIVIIKFTLYTLLLLLVASFMGLDTSSIMLFLLVVVGVVAISMQPILANVGSSFILYFLKPFKKNDFIVVSNFEGYFTTNNFYHTLLKKRDGTILHIPNSNILNSIIHNTDEKRIRRVKIDIYVSPQNDVEKIRKIVHKTIKGDERILEKPEARVILRQIRVNSIKIRCWLWVKRENYWDVLYSYNEKVVSVLRRNNIKFPENVVAEMGV